MTIHGHACRRSLSVSTVSLPTVALVLVSHAGKSKTLAYYECHTSHLDPPTATFRVSASQTPFQATGSGS